MDKELLMLVDYVDIKAIDPDLLTKCDRVAMTPDAMSAFEQNGLSYLTLDDLYDYKRFRNDCHDLTLSIEELLFKIDRKYEPFSGFPRSFTGNIYSFLGFLTNICYISKICRRINEIYGKVHLWSSSQYKKEFKVNLDFSSAGLAFHKCNTGLVSRVSMFRASLAAECSWVDNIHPEQKDTGANKHRFINSLKQFIKKELAWRESVLVKWNAGEKKSVFVIQDGYEVSFIKRKMPGFAYINPLNKLLRRINGDDGSIPDIEPLFIDEVKEFAAEWAPDFEEHILETFTLYHNRIISRIGPFTRDLDGMFKKDRPLALFFSVCANRVYEDVSAYLANKKGIPVFYFQHGGTSAFYEQPYQDYMEKNKNIEKINIFQSKIEKDICSGKISPESRALGSTIDYSIQFAQERDFPEKRETNFILSRSP